MSEVISLDRALCLPAADVAALLEGQLVAAIPKVSVQKGWMFALYSYTEMESKSLLEQQYRPHVLPLARAAIDQQKLKAGAIKAWARCEHCTLLHEVDQLETLSYLTIWTKDNLRKALEQRQHLFVATLRVYRMPEFIEVVNNITEPNKLGKFVSLPLLNDQFREPLKVTQSLPVLSDVAFQQRKQQLEELRPPLHPELEEFCDVLARSNIKNSAVRELEQDISVFLGLPKDEIAKPSKDKAAWSETIVDVGNSSDGYAFEKLVRKSLIELGFRNPLNNPKASLNPEETGGAGGLDVYCETPYPLAGECKASKHESVPNSVSAQLIHLGNTHLGKEKLEQSIKVIFAAGGLTKAAQDAAIGNQINIMRPETLQRLVDLKEKHPGSINLLDLKPCLEESPFGEEADEKVNRYIDKIWEEIKLRSQITKVVKDLTKPDKRQLEVIAIRATYNARLAKGQNGEVDDETVYDILKELSSPLTGYLGQLKVGSLISDRFYFLRDLPID